MALLTVPIHQTTSLVIEPQVTAPIVIEEVEEEVKEDIKDSEQELPKEACNCYLLVKNRVANLPRMAEIYPNAEPIVGAVAIEWFGNVKHVSLVTEVNEEGVWIQESNFHHCKIGTRFIPFTRASLFGFWIAG